MSDLIGQQMLARSLRQQQNTRRRYAEALLEQGASTAPVYTPLQGLARALTAAVGGWQGRLADEEDANREAKGEARLADYVRGQEERRRAQTEEFLRSLRPGGAAPGAAAPQMPSGQAPQGGQTPAPSTPPAEVEAALRDASAATGVPLPVLVAQARQESGFNPNAVGGAGEVGLMQILPSTARAPAFGLTPTEPGALRDPAANALFGARYLAGAGRGGDLADPAVQAAALARYNGGGDPRYVENVRRFIQPFDAFGGVDSRGVALPLPPPTPDQAAAGVNPSYVAAARGSGGPLAASGAAPPPPPAATATPPQAASGGPRSPMFAHLDDAALQAAIIQGAGVAQGDPQAAAILEMAQQELQQRRASPREFPTVQTVGPQGPGIYERTPQGLRFVGPVIQSATERAAPTVTVDGPQGLGIYERDPNAPNGLGRFLGAAPRSDSPGNQDARDDAILFDPQSDPNSPEYRAAYFRRTQPRAQMVQDPTTGQMVFAMVTPQLPPGVRVPSAPDQGAQAAPPAPPIAAAAPSAGAPATPTAPAAATPGAPPPTASGGVAIQPLTQPGMGPLTESQGRANLFGVAMEEANDILRRVQVPSGMAIAAWRTAPEMAVNLGLNSNDQQYFNALRLFAAGVLRRETGAAFTQQELLDVQSRFFPMPGDSPEVLRQKERAREQTIAALRAEVPGQRFRRAEMPGPMPGSTAEPPTPRNIPQPPPGFEVMR